MPDLRLAPETVANAIRRGRIFLRPDRMNLLPFLKGQADTPL